ncbi:MAG: hypothetical protein ACO39T_05570 [Flavobacteriaceae bacterium]|jgi:hypothetical protein
MMLILKGRSRHGKNRIAAFGSRFEIAETRQHINTVTHRNCIGPFAFLHSLDTPEASRWISLTDDPDFEIISNT